MSGATKTRASICAADLFCGAGGTSTGLAQAAWRMGLHIDLVAVNHWQRAVETHTRNHPWARHVCADLASVEADPNRLVTGGRLDLLVASPECTHHSVARGGKPCSDQSRASAWHVLHWCERLNVRDVLVENVKEFEQWGPLGDDGRPDKAHRGATFQAFVQGLRSMGYAVEWRVLNAADYGGATTRRRLFLRASRRGAIEWPDPTHAGKWRAAREIIDWNIQGQDIRERKRPLAPRTMARIEAGLRKFGGEAFIAVLRGQSVVNDVQAPLSTVSTMGAHHALCQPFLVEYHSEKRTGEARVASLNSPLPTQTTENRFGLAEPFMVQVAHTKGDRVRSVDDPLPTIPAGHRGEMAVVEPFVVPMEHGGRAALRSVREPLPTITTAKGGAFGICEPFLTKYYGAGEGARPVTAPLDTVTTKDRFALVEPYRMGVRFRMLQPHELAAAMGFHGYQFAGNKTEIVKQIGNAVQVDVAEALCASVLRREVA